jgi:hypothetical protein
MVRRDWQALLARNLLLLRLYQPSCTSSIHLLLLLLLLLVLVRLYGLRSGVHCRCCHIRPPDQMHCQHLTVELMVAAQLALLLLLLLHCQQRLQMTLTADVPSCHLQIVCHAPYCCTPCRHWKLLVCALAAALQVILHPDL